MNNCYITSSKSIVSIVIFFVFVDSDSDSDTDSDLCKKLKCFY